MLGLSVPAAAEEPVTLVRVKRTAAAVSELVGGGLLDEAGGATADGARFTVYTDEDRVAKGLRVNERAVLILSDPLGLVDRSQLAQLRGDVLVLGVDGRLDDTDVPDAVIAAAREAGWLQADAPSARVVE
jgi:hypothetical protein